MSFLRLVFVALQRLSLKRWVGSGLVLLFSGTLILFAWGVVSLGSHDTFYLHLTAESPAHQALRDRVAELHSKIGEVEEYERRLRERAAQLEAVISEASELEFDPSLSAVLSQQTDIEEAIGGGDENHVPAISSKPSRKTQAWVADEIPLIRALDLQVEKLGRLPIGYPVKGRISSGFGSRRSPFTRRYHKHRGVDIVVDYKTPIVSVADGTVVKAGWKGSLGRTIKIDHGNGIETVYGHLAKISVKVGEKVCRGERIGLVGSSGRSTGPHLHYGVYDDGKAKDPYIFLQLAGLLRLI